MIMICEARCFIVADFRTIHFIHIPTRFSIKYKYILYFSFSQCYDYRCMILLKSLLPLEPIVDKPFVYQCLRRFRCSVPFPCH